MKETYKPYQKQPPHQNVPASYLALIKDGKILLHQRANSGFFDGYYSLVSGHVENNENFTDAIIREAKEEINIVLSRSDVDLVHILHRKSDNTQYDQRVDAFFTASKWEGTITNMEPKKCSDIARFPLDDLPENIVPYIAEGIDAIKNNEFYSERGRDRT